MHKTKEMEIIIPIQGLLVHVYMEMSLRLLLLVGLYFYRQVQVIQYSR